MANRYKANEVMEVLGYQQYDQILSEANLNAISEIIKANLEDDRPDVSFIKYDLFVYGYLMGVRAERKRKKIKGKKLPF